MNGNPSYMRLLIIGGALALGAAGGFFVARMTDIATVPAEPTAAAPANLEEVKVDPSYLAVVGIVTETVVAGNLTADVLAPATVAAAPNGEAIVTAHAAGTIVSLAKQLGDPVRAAETLALVESRDAAAMAADLTVAQSKAVLARSAARREQELFNQRVTPRQDLERAQAELAVAEAEVHRALETANAAHVTRDGKIAVTSPLTGKITSAGATLGTYVQAETELFRIADPHLIQVEAAVTAMDAQRITVGDAATIAIPSGKHIAAIVRSTTPTVNEQTRAATVVLSLTADHESLSPGEIVQADITPKATIPAGVVVPEDAVQNVAGRNVVFARNSTGFRVQPVVAGARSNGRVAILSGLNAGETIATTNAFFLKAELNKGTGEDE